MNPFEVLVLRALKMILFATLHPDWAMFDSKRDEKINGLMDDIDSAIDGEA